MQGNSIISDHMSSGKVKLTYFSQFDRSEVLDCSEFSMQNVNFRSKIKIRRIILVNN